MEYTEIYRRLMEETAIVTFLKRDGKIRNMLATRNIRTMNLCEDCNINSMSWHDKKCGIDNGNVAVMDLIIGEGRSFNVERLIRITFVGVIDSIERFEQVCKEFKEFREQYEAENVMELTMNTFEQG